MEILTPNDIIDLGRGDKYVIRQIQNDSVDKTYYRVTFHGINVSSVVAVVFDASKPVRLSRFFGHAYAPTIYHWNAATGVVFVEDLGDSLFDVFCSDAVTSFDLYKKIIDTLVSFQIEPQTNKCVKLDYDFFVDGTNQFLECAKRSFKWIDEQEVSLGEELKGFAAHLSSIPICPVHGNFCSKNMRPSGQLLFVDQPALGPYTYDLASLLHDYYTLMPPVYELALVGHYMPQNKISTITPENMNYFYYDYYLTAIYQCLTVITRLLTENKFSHYKFTKTTMEKILHPLKFYKIMPTLTLLLENNMPSDTLT